MTGVSNLSTLLSSMEPRLQDGEYVFLAISSAEIHRFTPIMTFQEQEGTTVIVSRDEAGRLNAPYESSWKLITLTVHSNLQAIGLLATVCKKLADAEISVNVISAFYHDHLFVPPAKADDALRLLQELVKEQTSSVILR